MKNFEASWDKKTFDSWKYFYIICELSALTITFQGAPQHLLYYIRSYMPIIASAKKQLRQSIKKNARNTFYKKLYTESRVAFEKAIKAGNLEEAKSLYVNKTEVTGNKSGLQSIIDKLVKKNIIHANNASRKKSKFVRMMKSLEQA